MSDITPVGTNAASSSEFEPTEASQNVAAQSTAPKAPVSQTDTVEKAPVCGPCAPHVAAANRRVEFCERQADYPGASQLGLSHQWLRTQNKEAGMGPDHGDVPGKHVDLPFVTKTMISDHRGEGEKPGVACKTVPNEDADCVDRELDIGKPLGRWTPTNQCHTFVNDTLKKCSTDPTVEVQGKTDKSSSKI
jgi:hypothetical protein